MALRMPPRVTFVCVRNRVRSTFAEFYLSHLFREREEAPMVSSAGFFHQTLQDLLRDARIPLPEPFFDRPMSELTRTALAEKGIRVPENWRSKALTPDMVEKADLLVTAQVDQKEELCGIYEQARDRIFSIRELSGREDYLFFDDMSAPALDANYWITVEEDPAFVSQVLQGWRETLEMAVPTIMDHLGRA